jgi:hypothetical protein
MAELTDYSGPYKHDLRFEDFSKDFLIKMMTQWQRAYLRLSSIWYEKVMEKFGMNAADDCNLDVWLTVGQKVVPKFAKMGNVQPNTVLDALKIVQLAPDSHVGSQLFAGELDIKNENHVITSTTKCAVLEFFEKAAPERIEYFCHKLEPQVMEAYFNNPKIKVKPLKLPPRKSSEDICCRFEIKLEE